MHGEGRNARLRGEMHEGQGGGLRVREMHYKGYNHLGKALVIEFHLGVILAYLPFNVDS